MDTTTLNHIVTNHDYIDELKSILKAEEAARKEIVQQASADLDNIKREILKIRPNHPPARAAAAFEIVMSSQFLWLCERAGEDPHIVRMELCKTIKNLAGGRNEK